MENIKEVEVRAMIYNRTTKRRITLSKSRMMALIDGRKMILENGVVIKSNRKNGFPKCTTDWDYGYKCQNNNISIAYITIMD